MYVCVGLSVSFDRYRLIDEIDEFIGKMKIYCGMELDVFGRMGLIECCVT